MRAVAAFVYELDLAKLGFEGAEPAATGRSAYHPATLLMFTVTSTACRRAGAWSVRPSATLS